jgi:ADP-glucose pyrophosphorylase
MIYNRMLEDRIKKAQDVYYQEVATAINNSPTLSKMNVPVSSPVEGFEYNFKSTSNKKMKIGMFIIVLGLILGIGYVTLKKKD